VAALDAPENAIAGELFQAGTGTETTIAGLAAEIERAVGRPLEIRHAPARVGDVRRNVARVDKADRVLGYRASVTLSDGLARTAAWFAEALTDPELGAVRAHVASGSE
jgi:UDP-glucose 4-epimerase